MTDELAFTDEVQRYRRALHVHCYRLLGSLDDAEDVVQETFLRAWRERQTFEGRSALRSWLYAIATHACLDALRKLRRRALPHQVAPPNVDPEQLPNYREPLWLQPYPDRLLSELASSDDPAAEIVSRETIELTFIAALQLLTPRQRAVLVVRDVLGWSASDTAGQLGMTVAGVNSTLQRARATVQRHRPSSRLDWPAPDPTVEQQLLDGFIRACERFDAEAVIALLSDDIRCTMPPYPFWFDGAEAVAESFRQGLADPPGEWRSTPTRANGQPAAAAYVRKPGDDTFRAFSIHVLRIEHGAIAEIVGFHDPSLFEPFGFPPTL